LNILEFGEPELLGYKTPEGDPFDNYHIPVNNRQYIDPLIGYLLMPEEYMDPWVQLCYNIVYAVNVFRVIQKMCREKTKKYTDRLKKVKWTATTILQYYLHVQYIFIKEILSCVGGPMVLPIFNEYIFKEQFDLHWQDPLKIKQEYLTKSPFNEDMEDKMGKRYHLSFNESS
jgi:hypothetical protein